VRAARTQTGADTHRQAGRHGEKAKIKTIAHDLVLPPFSERGDRGDLKRQLIREEIWYRYLVPGL